MRVSDATEKLARLDVSVFEAIPSETTERDKLSLLACQAAVAALRPDYTYLEIGSHLGGSIQPHLLDARCRTIHSIDKRPPSQPDTRGVRFPYPDNTTARMLANLRAISDATDRKLSCFDRDASHVELSELQPRPDLCLIDGEHTEAAAYSDFLACLAFLPPAGGAVIFHDAELVHRAIQRAVEHLRGKMAFHAYTLPDSLFVIEVGDFPLHQQAAVHRLLIDNYFGFFYAMNEMEPYRSFATHPMVQRMTGLMRRARAFMRISAAVLLVITISCATPPSRVSSPPAVPVPNVNISADAEDVVARTNGERTRLGLDALARSPRLMKAAQLQADQMASMRTMAHDLPGAAFPSPESRLQAAGYRAMASGENVAEGYSSATTVVAGWMKSSGHRENIVSPNFTEMGAGVAVGSNGRRYYAQVFARPR